MEYCTTSRSASSHWFWERAREVSLTLPHTFMLHQVSRKSELCAKWFSSFYLFDIELKPFTQYSEEYMIKRKFYRKVYLISLFLALIELSGFLWLELTRISYCLKSKFHQPRLMTPPFKEFYGIKFCDEF